MCFHTALNATPEMLAKRYHKNDTLIQHFLPSFHISAFSHDYYPIVSSEPNLRPMQWGLIPYWIKNPTEATTIRNQTLNARSESIFTKPSFRGPIRHQRCLVPVTGFFDWHHEKDYKIPYFITVKNEPIFSLAGIYDYWKNPVTQQEILTFSILTTNANEMMTDIHNTNFRMPVILSADDEQKWIDPYLDMAQIQALMQPYNSNLMQAYPIRNDFLKKEFSDPSILWPK
ncbi:MAG: SOS response-associated peptidase [Bacteroidales bacterium]